jgi:hypothetical protein
MILLTVVGLNPILVFLKKNQIFGYKSKKMVSQQTQEL